MKKTMVRGVRMDAVLVGRCDTAAAKGQVSFSRWAREVFKRELKRLENGRKR